MADSTREAQVVAVVGSGIMGRGIAQLSAQAGFTTWLFDAQAGAAAAGRQAIVDVLRHLVEKGRVERSVADDVIGRIQVASDLAEIAGAGIVVEAIVEKLEIKKRLFTDLEAVVSDGCVLATNTSSLSVTAIAAGLRLPGRCAGFHFFNPAPLMKIVEVVAGARTAPQTLQTLSRLATAMGHKPVRVKDMPGFLVNHAGRGYVTEALRVLTEGVAGPTDVDRVMRDAAGFRMGPFELLDLTGLDVSHPVMESIYHQFYQEPRFRPSPEAQRRLDAGLLGRKAGEGFYRYGGAPDSAAEPPAPPDRPTAIWVSPAEPRSHATLIAFLGALPRPPVIEHGAVPSADALCLVTPFGADATTTAVEQHLDPTRTLAVDAIFDFRGRLTLMSTPLTSASYRRQAHGILRSGGLPVTLIADSPGFVVQRILATIANISCDIAQQRIADPTDIDDAVQLGLGYPAGPMTLGDRIGTPRLLQILNGLHEATGDPRYRPSLWLRRRALLRVPLATPDLTEEP